MSPSSSQETLRPSKKSGKLFIAEDDEDEDDDDDDEDEDDEDAEEDRNTNWPSSTVRETTTYGFRRSASTSSLTGEPAGMRRTESGMFMPFEEGNASSASDGLLGRVIDTVNTARDIAHVIWNVGWRR